MLCKKGLIEWIRRWSHSGEKYKVKKKKKRNTSVRIENSLDGVDRSSDTVDKRINELEILLRRTQN